MIRKRIAKSIMLGMCLSLLSAGGALAETNDSTAIAADGSVKTQVIDESLEQKQNEISKVLFEDSAAKLEDKGISVFYTVPMNNEYIEVAILPYTQESTDYVKALIGDDQVQIVEGVEPELMATSGMPEEEKVYKTTSVNDITDTKSSSTLPIVIVGIGGVVVLLGATVYIANRKNKID
jgi:hypothetical protein